MDTNLKDIHISQLYACSKINIASELLYVCELGKYLSNAGLKLSLDGVIIDSVLRKSKFWNYLKVAYNNRWVSDIGDLSSEMDIDINSGFSLKKVKNVFICTDEVAYNKEDSDMRAKSVLYNIMTPVRVQTFFQDTETQDWSWTMRGSSSIEGSINTRGLMCNEISQILVSIIAYIAVRRHLTGVPATFRMDFDSYLTSIGLSVSDVLLLTSSTDAVNGWFSFTSEVTGQDELQMGYEAWYYNGVEQGYLAGVYDMPDKIEHFNKLGFQLGDVINLYSREVCQIGNHVKEINGFNFAIIRKVDKNGLTLDVINSRRTKFGGKKYYENLSMASKELYNNKIPHQKFNCTRKVFSWVDIGVEYFMWDELTFITPLYQDDVGIIEAEKDGQEFKFELPVEEYIYWLLKDFDVEFNEAHFLKQFFTDKVPAYITFTTAEI